MAAVMGHKDVVELLLANGADVNAKGKDSSTSLHATAGNGQKGVVELLLANKADVNARDTNGWTPLHWAAGMGDKEVVEMLLASGADVNAKGKDGTTPFECAVAMGHRDVAESLMTSHVVSSAHGNSITDSRGYVTNADYLTPFTLTNSTGDVITNAVLVKLTPNNFIYKTPDGGEGMMRLDSLSKNLQDRFGYDPLKSALADEVERQRREAQREQDMQAEFQAALGRRGAYIESTKMVIEGEVLQTLDIGLLVKSASEAKKRAYEYDTRIGAPTSGGDVKYFDPATRLPIYNGLCFLTDYSKASSIVDGDIVRVVAYPNGEYTYIAVSGGSKTVRQFTCDMDAVSNAPTEAELNQLWRAKPREP
jgi:hypothetical protein